VKPLSGKAVSQRIGCLYKIVMIPAKIGFASIVSQWWLLGFRHETTINPCTSRNHLVGDFSVGLDRLLYGDSADGRRASSSKGFGFDFAGCASRRVFGRAKPHEGLWQASQPRR
jgi:hypothetical protein